MDRLQECAGQVCFTADSSSAGSAGLRMNIHTGTISIDPARSAINSRPIGDNGLISIQNPSTPEQIARQVGNGLLWKEPLSDLFGPGYGTDYGWRFQTFPPAHLAVGSVGQASADAASRTVVHLGQGAEMVGFNLTTGARLWRQAGGIDNACIPDQAITEDSALSTVRCRWSATSTVTLNRTKMTDILTAASVSLEGFDPRTGKTTWSVALSDPSGSSYESWASTIKVAGDQTLVVNSPKGQITVNPVTGQTAAAPTTLQVICTAQITTAIARADTEINGTIRNYYVTGDSMHTCTTAGRPIAPTTAWPSWAGAVVGHVHLIVTPAGLQGYRQ
ncbi:PQQ-binding-like beta-propeller repeat protein [Nakamurella panacisegetis]|uniref:PQQ-binding-like beta-propeller repeat protein n=1 Tax=Nakamurella panacisegetis TaxID=1090615 RepID=UPI0015608AEB|nr:PQQ-binding-like beta-propeller repeat protein [Nakamurella panacisegetis]